MAKTMASQVKTYVKLREEKEKLQDRIKDINREMDDIGIDFLDYLRREDCQRATFAGYTVFKTESTVFKVDDWDTFWDFAVENGFSHLVEKRPSVTGCRELLKIKGKIPGLEPYNKVIHNVRVA